MPDPTITVIVPTIGRPSLLAALTSICTQTVPPTEIVVVFDLPDERPLDVDPDVLRGIVLHTGCTGGGAGPSQARMLGVQAARSNLVAFLDDDDTWAPTKLERQLALFADERSVVDHPVVLTRTVEVDVDGTVTTEASAGGFDPDRTTLAEALFCRPSLRRDSRVYAGTCAILCERALMLDEPFDAALRDLEDWEWLLRVDARPDCRVSIVDEPLLRIRRNPPGTSAGSPTGGWWASVELARTTITSSRVRGDLLLLQASSTAIDHGHRRDGLRLAYLAFREGRPHAAAVVIWLFNFLFPQRLIDAVARMARSRGGSSSGGVELDHTAQ